MLVLKSWNNLNHYRNCTHHNIGKSDDDNEVGDDDDCYYCCDDGDNDNDEEDGEDNDNEEEEDDDKIKAKIKNKWEVYFLSNITGLGVYSEEVQLPVQKSTLRKLKYFSEAKTTVNKQKLSF